MMKTTTMAPVTLSSMAPFSTLNLLIVYVLLQRHVKIAFNLHIFAKFM